jgi:hypothetical protein
MTKAIEVCRALKAAGHRVILIETADYWFCAGRFSSAVDRFVTVPEHKRHGPRAYIDSIKHLIKEEQVDVFVPVAHTADVNYDAIVKEELSSSCFVWCETAGVCEMLDDRFRFTEAVRELGMPIAEQYKVSSIEDVLRLRPKLSKAADKFILKAIGSDPANRTKFVTDGPVPFHDEARLRTYLQSYNLCSSNPHVVMAVLNGKEYATTGIFRDGQVLAHTVSRACAVQLHFKHEHNTAIFEWVEKLAGLMQLTGSMSFDLMVVDGVVMPLECNPRLHTTVVNFYQSREVLSNAYLSPVSKEAADNAAAAFESRSMLPQTAKQSQWFAGELTYAVIALFRADMRACARHTHSLLTSREATFTSSDPMPYFWTYHVQMPLLFLWALFQLKPYNRIDYLVGKLWWMH